MRTLIAGFLSATLYTLAIATFIGMAMPTQAQLRTFVEATYLVAASAAPAQAIDAQPTD